MAKRVVQRESAVEAPQEAVARKTVKKSTSRRTLDDSKKPKIYAVVKGGKVWHKIRQENLTYFDESKGHPRAIRYFSNENSPFVDEQSGAGIREQIVFEGGVLTVPYTKPNLSKYLDCHPDNVANGGKVFKIVIAEQNAEKEVDREFTLFEAIGLIKNKSIDELIPVAMTLGIDVNQTNMEIKRELLSDAKRNPQKFISMFDNPVVETKSNILTAIDFQIVKNTPEGMYWFDTNRLICTTPIGQDTTEVFTRFCMTDKGSEVYEEIKRQLDSIA
jgi:hypothetical protein